MTFHTGSVYPRWPTPRGIGPMLAQDTVLGPYQPLQLARQTPHKEMCTDKPQACDLMVGFSRQVAYIQF